jgi:hypothetical protein
MAQINSKQIKYGKDDLQPIETTERGICATKDYKQTDSYFGNMAGEKNKLRNLLGLYL